MRIARLLLAGTVIALGVAPAADAAYVRPDLRWVWQPNEAEPRPFFDIIYDGEGSEANDIVVTSEPSRTVVVITDPRVKMRGSGAPLGVDPQGGRVYATWSCTTPGAGAATCAATPGSTCWSMYCDYIPGPAQFNGLLKLAGNSGDDRIEVKPGPFESRIWGVYGDDVIAVDNGSLDNVDCGPGTDQVAADPQDRVLSNCETVTRN